MLDDFDRDGYEPEHDQYLDNDDEPSALSDEEYEDEVEDETESEWAHDDPDAEDTDDADIEEFDDEDDELDIWTDL